MLSGGATGALVRVLQCIEAARRWPELLREVVVVALGKRTGGSILVGLATAPYRIRARIRYLDCWNILETGLQRPFFAAATGVGVAGAVFDASLACEATAARGDESACTLADLQQVYENIEIADFAIGGRRMGVPLHV